MPKLGIIDKNDTVFVCIDIQEKFMSVIHDIDQVISNTNVLLTAARILDVPVVLTEQYPQGLGKTSQRIHLSPEERSNVIEKMSFSCLASDEFASRIKKLNRDALVLFGIETHVCLLQTALRGVKEGYEVHVIADATSSRTLQNKSLALDRMRHAGVFVASTEMVLFQLLTVAGTAEFRKISKLIK